MNETKPTWYRMIFHENPAGTSYEVLSEFAFPVKTWLNCKENQEFEARMVAQALIEDNV